VVAPPPRVDLAADPVVLGELLDVVKDGVLGGLDDAGDRGVVDEAEIVGLAP